MLIPTIAIGISALTIRLHARRRRSKAIFVGSLIGTCVNAHAQTSINGSLRGRITDIKGAAVAGATVTLTNAGTNIRQSTATGEDGSYTFARIVPGQYSIVADKSGFKQVRRGNLTIAVNEAAVADLRLEVGQINETVSIEAGAAVVQSQSVEISGLVSDSRDGDSDSTGARFDGMGCPRPAGRRHH